MHSRLKELRKMLKLSQVEFGERLGVSRDVISNLEVGRVEPKESFIKLICGEFNINYTWLKEGNGVMFSNTEDEYTTLIDNIMVGENEFAKNIFKTFAKFEEEDWLNLERMMNMYEEIKKN